MNKIDKIIFLVGGKGTHLSEECKDLPKPLIQIGNKTLLDFSIDALKDIKFSEAIFVAGFLGEKIKDYVDRYDFSKRTIIQDETKIKGTAYAVWDVRQFVKPEESFLLVLPDSLWKFRDLNFLKEKDENTIFCMETKDAHLFGQIASDADNFVTAIGLKENPPKSFLVDIGVYYFSKAKYVFNYLEKEFKDIEAAHIEKEVYLTTLISDMIKDGHKFVMRELKYWYDCGTPDGLNKAREAVKNKPELLN